MLRLVNDVAQRLATAKSKMLIDRREAMPLETAVKVEVRKAMP